MIKMYSKYIVGPPGNGWTQIACGNIPVFNLIPVLQQCPVEGLDRLRISKIDGMVTLGSQADKARQIRADRGQGSKIIALLMTITRMQR